jgi:hypothetical protein
MDQSTALHDDGSITGSDDRSLAVFELDFDRDPRWDLFVASHPEGLVFHQSVWLRALKSEFGQELLALACADSRGALQGILPLIYTRGLPFGISRIRAHATGPRLTSLPRTPVSGPLANGAGALIALLREALRRVESRPGTTLEIKVRSNDLDGVVPGLHGIPWREAYVLELPPSAAPLRFGNAKQNHKLTWAVNRAGRLGIAAREAENEGELRQWYSLYLEAMRRVVAPARPYRFFLELWRELRPRRLMRLLLADRRQDGTGEVLAGSMFLMAGGSVHYSFTGCRTESLALHVNDVLQWEAIHRAHQEGFRRYDFGEVPEQRWGLAEFKSKWCARPQTLYRYYYPCPPVAPGVNGDEGANPRVVRKLWQHLPLGWTESIGSRIFSYL